MTDFMNWSRLTVHEDVPGVRLVLKRTGVPRFLVPRLVFSSWLIPWAAFPVLVDRPPPAWVWLVCLGVCALVSLLAGIPLRYCSRLTFDSAAATVSVRDAGWFLWLWWTLSVPPRPTATS